MWIQLILNQQILTEYFLKFTKVIYTYNDNILV